MKPQLLEIQPYKPSGQILKFDMMPCISAEHRLIEIATAGKEKAKELFGEFLRASLYAGQCHAMLQMHVLRAANESRKRRAVLLLDFIPTMAKERGLATSKNATGNEAVREAFLYTDPQFLQIEDGRAALEAAQSLMGGKMFALRDAAAACAKMLSPDERPHLNNMEIQPNGYGVDERPNLMESVMKDVAPELYDVDGFGKPA